MFSSFIFGIVFTIIVFFLILGGLPEDKEDSSGIQVYKPNQLYWNKLDHGPIDRYESIVKSDIGDFSIILEGYGFEKVSGEVKTDAGYGDKVWVWSVYFEDSCVKREHLNSEDSLIGNLEAKKRAKEKTFEFFNLN